MCQITRLEVQKKSKRGELIKPLKFLYFFSFDCPPSVMCRMDIYFFFASYFYSTDREKDASKFMIKLNRVGTGWH